MKTILTLFANIFQSNSYIPHGHCYLWQTPLVSLHVVSDALIAIAYFSIPIMLIYFVSKRSDIPFSKVFVLFGAFIILCGTGHLLDIWTLWHPDYWISGIVRAITALVSCYTALELVELLPQFLALRTPEQLEIINQELEKQITERKDAEETLQMIVAGTASVTGNKFFSALVQNLATALNVSYVMVSKTVNNSVPSLKTLAFWTMTSLAENIEYELIGTPCQIVLKNQLLSEYPRNLQEFFPDCLLLKQINAQSYVGLPLLDINENIIGNLCIIDTKPFIVNNRTKTLLNVFASRAAAELQRQWAEEEKHQAYENLELRVRERTVELERANESLKLAKENADAANRAKSEFLANMSHELRTPLNAILGFTQLMQPDKSLTLEHQKYINIINHSGEHLLVLINDVLEMSKIEAGKTTIYETEFDLYKLLSSLESMLQLKGQNKGLQLTFDHDATLPRYIKTDENKLRQILINLLGNAIKFTDHGSVTLRIRHEEQQSFTPTRYTLHFEVEDTGIGMDREELEKLFQAFQQASAGQKSKEGTGLGLRISQKFVQLMGGDITVRSQPHQGSCFTFSIQAGFADLVSSDNSFPMEGIIKVASGAEYRILIAEDNANNRLLLNQILNNLGFEVQEAENGKEAIAMWEQWQPHLIFMDMYMPILDGYGATRQIRHRQQKLASRQIITPTKIIALTASAFREQRQETLDAGCDDFISKPFRREEIIETLSNHLRIQFSYESILENTSNSSSLTNNSSIDKVDLAIMPIEWIDKLYAATAQGNDVRCLELIADIPLEQTSLIINLTKLIENYQFDKLMILMPRQE